MDASSVSVASIQSGHVSRTLNILTGISTAMTIGTTLINCLKPAQITGALTMTTGGASPIDMSGNIIKNLPNGVSALDATNKQQLDLKLNLAGGTLSKYFNFFGWWYWYGE